MTTLYCVALDRRPSKFVKSAVGEFLHAPRFAGHMVWKREGTDSAARLAKLVNEASEYLRRYHGSGRMVLRVFEVQVDGPTVATNTEVEAPPPLPGSLFDRLKQPFGQVEMPVRDAASVLGNGVPEALDGEAGATLARHRGRKHGKGKSDQ